MRLIDAFDAMEYTLIRIDASQRQLAGMRAWRFDAAVAVQSASVVNKPRGVTISDRVQSNRRWIPNPGLAFVHGDHTHRAWARMCRAALNSLGRQHAHAAALHAHFKAVAVSTDDPAVSGPATALANKALQWAHAASAAAYRGRLLLAQENRISQPIGHAVAAAGGIRQVAQDRNYHQAGTR